jgi:hypothetical protein
MLFPMKKHFVFYIIIIIIIIVVIIMHCSTYAFLQEDSSHECGVGQLKPEFAYWSLILEEFLYCSEHSLYAFRRFVSAGNEKELSDFRLSPCSQNNSLQTYTVIRVYQYLYVLIHTGTHTCWNICLRYLVRFLIYNHTFLYQGFSMMIHY